VIALIEASALGATHSDTPKLASKLGNAVRLTNLLRDVKKDRDRGPNLSAAGKTMAHLPLQRIRLGPPAR